MADLHLHPPAPPIPPAENMNLVKKVFWHSLKSCQASKKGGVPKAAAASSHLVIDCLLVVVTSLVTITFVTSLVTSTFVTSLVNITFVTIKISWRLMVTD